MATFIYTGEECINADHIISIDNIPGTATIWIRLDTGDKYARSAKYLKEILETLCCRNTEQNESMLGRQAAACCLFTYPGLTDHRPRIFLRPSFPAGAHAGSREGNFYFIIPTT